MVMLHLLRSCRYVLRGELDRRRALRSIAAGVFPKESSLCARQTHALVGPPVVAAPIPPASEAFQDPPRSATAARPPPPGWTTDEAEWLARPPQDPKEVDLFFTRHYAKGRVVTPVYCGLRMTDILGHINNTKYLEIMEFGRWHAMWFLGLGSVYRREGIATIMANLSIHYVREIRPCTTVLVTTEMMSSNHPKRILVNQEVWSQDGQKLHAGCLMEMALLGPASFQARLEERFGSESRAESAVPRDATALPGVVPSTPHRLTLNAPETVAEILGLPLKEVQDTLAQARTSFLSSNSCHVATGGLASEEEDSPDWLDNLLISHHKWRRELRQRTTRH